ncbi:MAG: hypothetical protein ACTSXF_07425, partial [Promethearchaeota archaeon]
LNLDDLNKLANPPYNHTKNYTKNINYYQENKLNYKNRPSMNITRAPLIENIFSKKTLIFETWGLFLYILGLLTVVYIVFLLIPNLSVVSLIIAITQLIIVIIGFIRLKDNYSKQRYYQTSLNYIRNLYFNRFNIFWLVGNILYLSMFILTALLIFQLTNELNTTLNFAPEDFVLFIFGAILKLIILIVINIILAITSGIFFILSWKNLTKFIYQDLHSYPVFFSQFLLNEISMLKVGAILLISIIFSPLAIILIMISNIKLGIHLKNYFDLVERVR